MQQPDFGGRGPRSYPPEFRRRVLDLVASGRKVAEVAQLLDINDQTISVWRRQHLIDTGQLAGTDSSDCPNWLRPASASPSWWPSWPSTGELPHCWECSARWSTNSAPRQ
ncbi:transposase [Streptomyces sp. NBC_00124]|uniref:transposase n=1 Tax=Streptomyces sp. NBC_00124 TaxID=2975662 RepID=UPI002253922D|nr:transposase [Streptomyces sp. NBC_00124]MCX5367149.1 transposase [Streptomyces sp. NBC_00124]